MLNIKLTGPYRDFSFEKVFLAEIYGEDDNWLRSYNDFKQRDLVGWYLISVKPYGITVSNEPDRADISRFACVCLDCGRKSVQLTNKCEECGSEREQVYLEI